MYFPLFPSSQQTLRLVPFTEFGYLLVNKITPNTLYPKRITISFQAPTDNGPHQNCNDDWGGIYAVKQLAKTAERRHDNQSNTTSNNQGQGSRENGYPSQGYWGGPGGQQGPPPRPYYQDQREWPAYNQGYGERYPGQGEGGAGDYSDHSRSYNEDYRYQQREKSPGRNPPSYYPQQQQQQGYVTRFQESSRGGQTGQMVDGLVGMATEFGLGNGSVKQGKMDNGLAGFIGK